MKNKKLLFKISIIIALVLISTIIVLSFLGKKEREGYLSEFKLNIDKTLQINGLDPEETKKLFEIEYKLDVYSITNYIFTNNFITNYSYDFRIKYYSKIFRNSDIYGVYPDLNNLPEYIQSIKMNDNSGTPFGNFVSTKIMDSEKIDNINYKLKTKFNIFITLFILFLILLITIFIYKYNEIRNYLSKYIDFQYNNNFIIYSDIYKKYQISNILFIIYLIILGFIIFSTSMKSLLVYIQDIFAFGTYYNAFYNIYDFNGYFWERGRHFVDILISLYMRPFGNILISIFNIDPFKALMISKSFFTVFYVFLTSFSLSYFIYIINKKHYKLFFILISLYIYNFTPIYDYINISAHIASLGISILIFIPMIYYFIYDKEIIVLKNKNMNYILYLFILYFATFTIESASLTLSGLSFFIILYLFIKNNDLFILDSNNKISIHILFILLSTIILTITSFLLTSFYSGRGNWQIDRIEKIGIINSIVIKIEKLPTFNKFILVFAILILIFFIIKIYINRKILKKDYIYFSICFTGLFLVIFLFAIDTYKVWSLLLLLFTLLISIVIDMIYSKNTLLSIISSFLLIFLVFNLSLKTLNNYDKYIQKEPYIIRDWTIIIDIYKKAKNDNVEEIIITQDDINRLELNRYFVKATYSFNDNPNNVFNKTLSQFMQRYYINKYIPIKVFYD